MQIGRVLLLPCFSTLVGVAYEIALDSFRNLSAFQPRFRALPLGSQSAQEIAQAMLEIMRPGAPIPMPSVNSQTRLLP